MSEVESRTAPLKFLVVEDHPEVAQNNCEWLQRIAADAQCIAVSNPMDAIRRLQREQLDLVVADLLYGQTTGEQSAEPGLELFAPYFRELPHPERDGLFQRAPAANSPGGPNQQAPGRICRRQQNGAAQRLPGRGQKCSQRGIAHAARVARPNEVDGAGN
jgi:hypothetical protein